MPVKIDTCVVGPIQTNCYIVSCDGQTIVIDPGDDGKKIIDALAMRVPQSVILTHGHWDHVGAVDTLTSCYNAEVLCHLADSSAAKLPSENGGAMLGIEYGASRIDGFLDDGDIVKVGQASFRVMHTPGHTIGSICLYEPEQKLLFSGDTLFRGTVGRTDFPTGSLEDMKASCRRLQNLPSDVAVYPGHGPATTIGYECENNPLLQQAE